ncbi:SMP-30/gluconolactonase/LRE family protein [Aspergillus undulatus]|uniref:SMP-30/gluconolactonase/LRE family protein n=1 Tax=Aspergillus undulatus TaxID=1810928 RepID=UPI003CCD14F3
MPQASPFIVHNTKFNTILGESPTLELLAENEAYPFAHEAGVFIPSRNELYITSNRIQDPSGIQRVQITKVHLNDASASGSGSGLVTCEELSVPIPMANGGVNYKDGVLICAQGSLDMPSGLYYMSTTPPYTTNIIASNFHGRPFNSVNDVVVHSDGSFWFTDPIYGYEQGYRPAPRLPSQVYRFDPVDGSIHAMADGFGRPNGICFSPDEKIVYVTDTDWIHGGGTTDDTRVSSM